MTISIFLAIPATEPTPLGWISPPLVTEYQVVAVGPQGGQREVQPSHFFRHYMAFFSMRFDYLSMEKFPPPTSASASRHKEMVDFLEMLNNDSRGRDDSARHEYRRFLDEVGEFKFDGAKSQAVERLLKAYIGPDCVFEASSDFIPASINLRHFYQFPRVEPATLKIERIQIFRRDVALMGPPKSGQKELLKERVLDLKVCE